MDEEQIAQQLAAAAGGAAPGAAGPATAQQQQQQQQQMAEMEERRKAMLIAILDNDARERLSRVAIVKPEKARAVENMLLQMMQRGQLGGKVNEDTLVDILGRVTEQNSSQTKITFARKRMNFDDDDW